MALLVAGALLALLFGDHARWTVDNLLPFVIAVGLLTITPLTRALGGLLAGMRYPGSRARAITAVVVAAISFAVLIGVPMARGHELMPRSHDEQMHLLQMRMVAQGRLWMPAHPVGDFFETFFVLTRPKYAAIYFPGASLLLTPTAWFGLPYWFMPVLYASIAVGLLYRVLAELIDGVAGVLGATLLLASTMFRELAPLAMSHVVMLMLGLAVTWAWLCWRSAPPWSPRAWRWACLAGVAAGLGAITRPIDAACFVTPLALASLPALRRMGWRAAAVTAALTVAGAAPLFAMQLAFNLGVTGRLLHTPYQLYLETQQPQSAYGFFQYDPDIWPESQLVQKHLYYDQFIRPDIERHRPEQVATTFLRQRLPILFMTTVAHPLLLLALPVGLLGLRGRWGAAAVFAALPMFIIAYSLNPFLLSHYLVVWIAPIILLIVAAPVVIGEAFPRVAAGMPVTSALLILAAAVSAQPGINPNATNPWTAPLLSDVRRQLAALPHKPAVVLFRYDPRGNLHHEPVYNVDTAWPDDAQVVRAHDLGERNVEIVRYYAGRQPERVFYLYDQASRQLHALGPAKALMERGVPTTTHTATP